MYQVDLYTNQGTIIDNECANLSEVFKLIEESINIVQLINIQPMKSILSGIMVVLAVSCGPVTKVDIRGTRDAITITTNQAVNDSSTMKIEINPNFDFRKHLKEVE